MLKQQGIVHRNQSIRDKMAFNSEVEVVHKWNCQKSGKDRHRKIWKTYTRSHIICQNDLNLILGKKGKKQL